MNKSNKRGRDGEGERERERERERAVIMLVNSNLIVFKVFNKAMSTVTV
jgi:hypothetical protein